MDGREYPWGNEFESERCNAENKLGETSAVGIYPQGQSPYGLMDISGNVLEWCLNKYGEPQMVTADLSGAARVLRGGSWRYDAQGVRSANRSGFTPDFRNFNIGFRLVLP
jgi:formylglycine-generating enzyme required for sulfatase activity